MSCTNSELEFIKADIPLLMRHLFPNHILLTFFIHDQRKKIGPRFNIYLKSSEGKLLRQVVSIFKRYYYPGGSIFQISGGFHAQVYRSNDILPLTKTLHFSKGNSTTIIRCEKDFIILTEEEDIEELRFLTGFFKVPLVSEETYLRRKYGKHKCVQCGRCCSSFRNVEITEGDFARWKKENRGDILRLIHKTHRGFLLPMQVEGRDLCPFLKNNLCSIQATKPETCRDFPFSMSQALYVRCGSIKEKLEREEIRDQKRWKNRVRENLCSKS